MHIMNILPLVKYFSLKLLAITAQWSISKGYYIQAHIFDFLHHYKFLAILYIYICAIRNLEVKSKHNCNDIFCISLRRITLFNNMYILRFYYLLSNCPLNMYIPTGINKDMFLNNIFSLILLEISCFSPNKC